MISREGMADQNSVGFVGVQRAVGFIGKVNRRKLGATVQLDWPQ